MKFSLSLMEGDGCTLGQFIGLSVCGSRSQAKDASEVPGLIIADTVYVGAFVRTAIAITLSTARCDAGSPRLRMAPRQRKANEDK